MAGMDPKDATTIVPFRLRGLGGRVEVECWTNEDPGRWGYGLLEGALGFPAAEALGSAR